MRSITNPYTSSAVAGLWLLVATMGISAQEVSLNLCTASADGVYYAVGQKIAGQVESKGLAVEVIETEGSMDNLQRMAAGECNAAVVQVDAYLTYQDMNQYDRLAIKRPHHLYDEYLHLVCNSSSGVQSIIDMSDGQFTGTLHVGPQASGGATTWSAISLLNPGYASIETSNIGGDQALQLVESAADASCMIYVSGTGSPFSNKVDALGNKLHLVSIDDETLDDAEFADNPIYSFRNFPDDAYPVLAKGVEVETLTVRALFLIGESWAVSYPDSYEQLQGGLERSMPEIRGLVSQ